MNSLKLSREEVEQAVANAFRGGPDRMTLAQDWLTLHGRLKEAVLALERIALLDEADGHELKKHHAFEAVAIATRALGKHPSQIQDPFQQKETGQ